MARRDLPALVGAASGLGLYSNLITSGTLGGARGSRPSPRQASSMFSSASRTTTAENGDRIAGMAGAHERKTRFAAAVRAAGLPLTLNMVVHRQNLAGCRT